MKHSLSVGSLSPKGLELVPRWLSAVQNRTTVLLLSREGGTVGGGFKAVAADRAPSPKAQISATAPF